MHIFYSVEASFCLEKALKNKNFPFSSSHYFTKLFFCLLPPIREIGENFHHIVFVWIL
jgi:hypothetical protein